MAAAAASEAAPLPKTVLAKNPSLANSRRAKKAAAAAAAAAASAAAEAPAEQQSGALVPAGQQGYAGATWGTGEPSRGAANATRAVSGFTPAPLSTPGCCPIF